MDELLQMLLSGVGFVGDVVDTPGSWVRNTMAGENPFKGTFSPEERTSGRGVLEKWGALDENQEGLDMGDVAGFGLELVADPLNLLGLGAAKNVARAGKEARGLNQASLLHNTQVGLENAASQELRALGYMPEEILDKTVAKDVIEGVAEPWTLYHGSPYAGRFDHKSIDMSRSGHNNLYTGDRGFFTTRDPSIASSGYDRGSTHSKIPYKPEADQVLRELKREHRRMSSARGQFHSELADFPPQLTAEDLNAATDHYGRRLQEISGQINEIEKGDKFKDWDPGVLQMTADIRKPWDMETAKPRGEWLKGIENVPGAADPRALPSVAETELQGLMKGLASGMTDHSDLAASGEYSPEMLDIMWKVATGESDVQSAMTQARSLGIIPAGTSATIAERLLPSETIPPEVTDIPSLLRAVKGDPKLAKNKAVWHAVKNLSADEDSAYTLADVIENVSRGLMTPEQGEEVLMMSRAENPNFGLGGIPNMDFQGAELPVPPVMGKDLYSEMRDLVRGEDNAPWLKRPAQNEQEVTTDLLKALGYDSILHEGGGMMGRRMGPGNRHDVMISIADNPSDIMYKAGKVAPYLQPELEMVDEPSLYPLLAALLGYNAGMAPERMSH